MGKVDVTSDTWTLHPPMASLQPSIVLLILQGQDEGMQRQRDEGRLLCFPSPVAHSAFSTGPLDHSMGARGLCPSPNHPEGSGECVYTPAHPPTHQVGRQLPTVPSPSHIHTGPSSLSLPTPHTSKLSCSWHWSMQLILVTVTFAATCTLPDPTSPSLPDAAGCSPTVPRIPNPFSSTAGPHQHLPDGQGKERACLSRE